ncbi:MAG: discoidin domain-containing protein [Verrucomicrobia bacterium]|nr:discoidin domain-containing protein [Verrucomicrobiota bacterium]
MLRRTLLPAVTAILPLPGGLFAAFDGPAPAREQIEADWLRQDEKRSLPAAPAGRKKADVTLQLDAAGGVDGHKDGRWGFHTEYETNPWWQVDLQQPVAIGRLVLWNRCDSCGARNSRIIVSVSDDGKSFRQVYQHDGRTFFGFTDKKPLAVELKEVTARFVKLSLNGKSYFHLDEVEIFAAGTDTNVALGKPATQSSTSTWSAAHDKTVVAAVKSKEYPLATIVERGQKLAASLRRLGATVDGPLTALDQAANDWKQLPKDAGDDAKRAVYFRARWAVRAMALKNPLLDFDSVLFVKRAPGLFPHMSDQHYGWWSRPGGGIHVLDGFKGGQPRVRCLTSDMPVGSFIGPDISYDGKRVLFAYCRHYPELADEKDKASKVNVPEDAFYHVFVMNVDGSGRRQLTRGKYDDFDARWLPGGDIAFLTTRKGLALQCNAAFSDATRGGDLPDSYVRCGGDNYRPVPVFTLHAMDAAGKNIRPLSAFENFEWTPSLAHDGRILYARWDYIDRFNGPFISLWSANQDGTNPQLVYGNYTV